MLAAAAAEREVGQCCAMVYVIACGGGGGCAGFCVMCGWVLAAAVHQALRGAATRPDGEAADWYGWP
jgi:hypothetical protein